MDCSWIKVILKWTTLFDDDFNEEELWEDVDSEEESSMENNEESGEDVDSEEKSSTENDKSTNITQLDRLEMDPLVARAYHNLNKSWLQQFPTEILLMIMEQLEDSDLLRLRRTSRIFLIHFGLRAFERCHQRSHNLRKELWQCSSTADAKRGSRPPDDILKEMYCTSCFTACSSRYAGGPTPEQDYFHCGGCGSDHQAQAFSATQIQKPPAERICIGREGRFKLCKHVSLGWSDVVKALESGNMMIAECSHRSHGFAPRDRHGNKNGQKVAIKLEKWNDSGHFLRLRSDTYVWLETQGRDRPTARQLRQRLEEIARISPIPWYPFDIPRLSPMRLVDPNVCLCLEYEGADQVDWHLRVPGSNQENSPRLQPRCWSSRNDGNDTKVCADNAHRLSAHNYEMSLSASFSQRELNCAYLTLQGQIHFVDKELAPWSPAWIHAMDPLSYKLPDFYGVTWCLTKSCRNYVKSIWKSTITDRFFAGRTIYDGKRINRKCECTKKST